MADVNANIGVNIDTSEALVQLKDLQRQISQFHSSVAKSSEAAALAQRDLQRNFLNSVNALGAFSAELRTVKTTAESFTSSLENNKFSMREYFRYAGGATKTFGRLFKSEFDTIGNVAEERVKTLQTQFIKMGRDATGAMKAIAIRPDQLDLGNYSTQAQIAAQKQAIFNQLMKQGSTNLLNFGKNTQWAGRQLMVGFTLPLMAVGSAASKTFMEMEAQALKFRKVYGDLFTTQAESQQALDSITELGRAFTKYGIAVSDTVGLAADAAAAGFKGIDLQRQTTEATRLSVLGQIDSQQALQTTISLQNAFAISSADLAGSIDFLNAVENQTVTSLDDITIAIPKVAPVIQQLGGDVKDLAFFLTAMKEGGINASEGANALKSGLAALINPTNSARKMLQGMGIDINAIVKNNQGDLKATVIGFAQALDTLNPLARARAIEQMFGKFQFARLSTLFQNVTKDGTQAARVLELAGTSVQDLASLSDQELGKTADSAMNKFRKSVEDLKVAIVPVGEAFLKVVTPILDVVSNIAEKFSNLSDGTKKAITVMVTVIGGLGPIVLMTFGLLANGVANIIKLFLTLRTGYQKLTGQSQNLGEQTQYMTMEQLDAAAAAHSLEQSHARLTQQFSVEATAVNELRVAYEGAIAAGARFASLNPGMMTPPPTRKYANGVVSVPGTGTGDTVPAMLTPGEAVIPAPMAKKYGGLINGMIAGNIPGYSDGLKVAGISAPVGTQFGHITTTMETTIGAFLQSLRSMSADMQEQHSSTIHYLQQLVDLGLAAKKLTTYSGLGVWQGEALNEALGKGGRQVPKQMILDDMQEQGISRWAPALAIGGATLEEVNGELVEYEARLSQAITDFENMHGSTTMSGQELEALEQQVRETLPATSRLKKALDLAADTITEFRVSLNKSDIETVRSVNPEAVIPAVAGQSSSGGVFITGVSGKQRKVRSKGDNLKAREPGGMGSFSAIAAAEAQELTDEVILATAREAGVQSPSKRTIPIGEDIARGLEVGMNDEMPNVVATAERVADAAVVATQSSKRRSSFRPQGPAGVDPTTTTQRRRRSSFRPQGPSDVPGAVLISKLQSDMVAERKAAEEAARQQEQAQLRLVETTKAETNARQSAISRMNKLNSAVQGGSFALMSLSGMAQMFGGSLGKVSSIIFNVSGALFALQTVTQLLTQTKALELIQSRLSVAKQAAAFASYGKGLAGGSGFIGLLSRAAIALRVFLGPVGIATAVVAGMVGVYKLLAAAEERRRKELEAFSDALITTTEQVKSLGDYFGVTVTKSGLQEEKGFAAGTTAQRSEVQKFKESDAYKTYAAPTVSAISRLSASQATQVLNAKMLELLGAGFSKEQIQTIITAIQQEAGKTDLKIDFKAIDFESLPEQVIKSFEKGSKKIKPGAWTTALFGLKNQKQEALVPFKNQAELLNKYLNGVSSGFLSGQISGEKFNNTFGKVVTTLEKMPDKQNALLVVDQAIKNMLPKVAKAATGVSDLKDKMLLLQAAALGLGDQITKNMVAALSYVGTDPILMDVKGRKEEELKKLIADATKAQEEINKAMLGTGDGGGDGKKSNLQLAIEQLQKQQAELKNTTNAYKLLTKAGLEASVAMEYAKDPTIALGLATKGISTKQIKQFVDLIKQIEPLVDSQAIKDFFLAVNKENKMKQNFTGVAKTISDMGGSLEDINNILGNPDIVSYLSDPMLTTAQTAERIKRYLDAIKTGKNLDLKINLSTPQGIEEAFSDLASQASDYFSILERNIQDKFSAPIKSAEDAAKKASDAVKVIQDEISGLQNDSSVIQRQMELTITRPLDLIAQRSAVLTETMTLIDHIAEGINSKYDAQAKALEQVSQINQDIVNQQKQQLDLASALTSGDISAAAQAAQEMRATQAATATGRASGALEAARDAAIAGISVNGMTAEQIKTEQYNNERKSFALEQQRLSLTKSIQLIDDKIYTIQVGKLATAQTQQDALDLALTTIKEQQQAELDAVDAQRERWDKAQLAIDNAKIKAGEFDKVIEASNGKIKTLADTWNGIQSKAITLSVTEIRNVVSSAVTEDTTTKEKTLVPGTGIYLGSMFIPPQYKSMGGMIPRYMASGGIPRGTDTVPAMLTPGEFVVRKFAVDKFGVDNLKAINNGTFSPKSTIAAVNNNSNSVYNYGINVNVSNSNASTDDIARAVMTQIKNVDNQRIRGQR